MSIGNHHFCRSALLPMSLIVWIVAMPIPALACQDTGTGEKRQPETSVTGQSPSGQSSSSKAAAADRDTQTKETAKTETQEPNTQQKVTLDAEQQKALLQKLAQQSQNAKTATDYSAVIQACETALDDHNWLSANQQYIRSLIGWSLNRRGEMRMELGFEFSQVANSEQADRAFEKASADFHRAIQEDDQHWKAYLNRGIIRAQQEQWDQAIADWKTSVKLRPSQTYAYFNLAEAEFQRGNFQASIQYYDHILKAAEDDAQALNGKALSLAGLQRFDEALQIYDQLIENQPNDAWLLTNKGDVLQAMGRWSEAETTYVEALKHEQAAAIYRRLAWLFATCPDETIRQSEGAMVLAKKSISLSRSTSAAQWDALAAAQALNGEFRNAIDSLKQALELEPENQELLQRQELYGQSETFQQVPKVSSRETSLLDR